MGPPGTCAETRAIVSHVAKGQRTSGRTGLIERVYENRAYALVLGVALISVILLAVASNEDDQAIASVEFAVASGLLVSAAFSALQVYFTNNEFVELVRTEIRAELDSLAKVVDSSVGRIHRNHVPTAAYRPADSLANAFNDDLTQHLTSTRTYRFRGLTGVYVAQRFRECRARVDQLRLIIADPRDSEALRFRLQYEMNTILQGSEYHEAVAAARAKTLKSLVGLFQVRHQCRELGVLFSREIPPDRIELFDEALFITLFDSGNTDGYEFPSSYQYSNQSVLYSIASREFDLQFSRQSGRPLIIFRADDTHEGLRAELATLGFDVTIEQIAEIARSFEDDAIEFGRRMRAEHGDGRPR